MMIVKVPGVLIPRMYGLNMIMKLIKLTVSFLALFFASEQSGAITFDLCTGTTTKTMPDGKMFTLWGYGIDTGSLCSATVPGPQITVPAGDDTLTVNLHNELNVPVSIVIPGQHAEMTPVLISDDQGRTHLRSLTHETAPTTTGVYNWDNLKPGTFLYNSGTYQELQVQMGLYGSVRHYATEKQAYSGISYDNEVTLLFSEITPVLHESMSCNPNNEHMNTSSTVNDTSKYFLLNGAPYESGDTQLPAYAVGNTTLIRFLNAGMEDHALILQGQQVELIAENSNLYPWPRMEYAIQLAAGTTKDGLFKSISEGPYTIYDRRLRNKILLNKSIYHRPTGPTAVIDTIHVVENSLDNSIDILINDQLLMPSLPINKASLKIETPAINGQATININDYTVTYTPTPKFTGSDSFTYTVRDSSGNLSNIATVDITVALPQSRSTTPPSTYKAQSVNRSTCYAGT